METCKPIDKLPNQFIGYFACLIGIFLLASYGKYLIIIFPLSSFCVGVFLYFRSPHIYISFTLWMWFLGSFVRRLIDYQSGFLTPGPWNLAAYLVTIISVETLVKNIIRKKYACHLPFLLCFLSILYACLVGLAFNPITETVIIYNLNWIAPLSFSYFIFSNWQSYPLFIKTIQNTFSRGLAIMSIYGVFQFLFAPPWDRFFLEKKQILSQATSFGTPNPYGMRIWGTMGSPHSFGIFLLASLLLLSYRKKHILSHIFAVIVGYTSLLLTKARTIWLAWLIGFLLLIFLRNKKNGLKLVASLISITLLIGFLVSIGPLREFIYPRLETLFSLSSDVSLQSRIEGHRAIEQFAVSEIFGRGLGFSISEFGSSLGRNDSAILPFLLTFGWLGSIPYLAGILLMFTEVSRSLTSLDIYASASFSIASAIFLQLGLLNIFASSVSIMFWFFLGVALSASKYYRYEQLKFQLNTARVSAKLANTASIIRS